MTTPTRTILLTGFGPFPGVPENASAKLVQHLAVAAQARFPRRRVVAEVLETAWEQAPGRLAEIYRAHSPEIAVHFGVSERAQGFVIETVGRNVCRDAPDVRGHRPLLACISKSAPESLPTTLPAVTIVDRLRQHGLPAELSDDAGGYLCNAVLFHALCLDPQRSGKRGFVHVPSSIGDGGVLSWDEAMTGGLEIVRAALGLPKSRLTR